MRYLLVLILAILTHASYAQTCFPDDLYLLSQDDIDSFSINHPNCTTISGNVYVHGEEIMDLSGFNQIEVIYGGLNYAGTKLKTLGGFEKLEEVWGHIVIAGNDSLISLVGFPPLLDTLRFRLTINNNENLSSLEGLGNIEVIQSVLQIGWPDHDFDQPKINSLEGLSSIQRIRTLYLRDLALESLAGLESLEHLEHLRFLGLRNLKDITSLENTNISDVISISGATSLGSLEGLESVQSLNYALELGGLSQLTDLEPIKNIDLTGVKRLRLVGNDGLSNCAVRSICQAIEHADSILISNNNTGCNSEMEVENQCLTSSSNNVVKSIAIYPNPANNEIILPLDKLHYKIINVEGKVVQAGMVKGQRIELVDFPRGLYILHLYNGGEIYQQKFVKN